MASQPERGYTIFPTGSRLSYGLPLVCGKCPVTAYYGMLKVPGVKAVPCPNCGTPLVPKRKKR